jgi:serine protease AprX
MKKSCLRAPFIRVLLIAAGLIATANLAFAQLLPPPPLLTLEETPSPPPPEPDPAVLAKLDPLIKSRLTWSGDSRVIVQAASLETLGEVALLITDAGGTLGRELPIVNGRAATLPNAAVLALAASPLVQRIAFDRLLLDLSERTADTVGATAVRQQLGLNGAGIGVALIDSGVTAWHNDLADVDRPGTQRVDRFVDFVDGQTSPSDGYGHGTHVAGIIAGNGADSGGARAGIAPKARLVVLKVLDAQGRGRISDVIAAVDYAVTHKQEFNIRVINMSMGASVHESYNTDMLTLATRRAVEAGIVVVASAGNRGRNSDGAVQYGSITAPGNAPWVLTVGASSHMGTVTRADDTVASFSSRGPTAIDYAAKPDLVAPGVGIYSLSAPESRLYESHTNYLLSGIVSAPPTPYLSLSGTSQAAPVVAGTVALMLQANPTLTPNAVKAILQFTAQQYDGHAALAQGAGFLNAKGAVDLAREFTLAPESRQPAPSDWSRHITWGNQRLEGAVLVSTAAMWETTTLWGGPVDGGATAGFGVSSTTNVVWGISCDGVDCSGRVWATSSDDTVVWGNNFDGDTVVWGNSADADTVVWGNSYADTVVWGNSSTCESVIWPES